MKKIRFILFLTASVLFSSGSVLNATEPWQDTKLSFEKFEEISRPILRKDQFAASMARYKIFTLDKSESDEAKRLLGIIENNSANDDWNNVLFAALQWYQLGDKRKADELLIKNIDISLVKMMQAIFEGGVKLWHYDGTTNPMLQDITKNKMVK